MKQDLWAPIRQKKDRVGVGGWTAAHKVTVCLAAEAPRCLFHHTFVGGARKGQSVRRCHILSVRRPPARLACRGGRVEGVRHNKC